MREKTFIYALFCPVEGQIKYIGKSNDPKSRFRKHLQMVDGNLDKIKWISELLSIGKKPEMIILEEVLICDWKQREKFYIKKHINTLLNICGGGNGLSFGNQTSFKGKPKVGVVCLNRDGEFVKSFGSCKEAREFAGCRIHNVLVGKRKSAAGYLWLYESKYKNMSTDDLIKFVTDCNMDNRQFSGVKTRFKAGQKPHNSKPIKQYDLNGNYMKTWSDAAEASLYYTNKKGSAIYKCATGGCKSALGFIWRY